MRTLLAKQAGLGGATGCDSLPYTCSSSGLALGGRPYALSSTRRPLHTTSPSLLERLRQPGDQEAWTRFVKIYTPLLYQWARRSGLPQEDAADLVQDVFALLVRKLPSFQYAQGGSFRAWLRTVTLNRRREVLRRATPVLQTNHAAVHEPEQADPAREFEEAEYREYVIRRVLVLLRSDFSVTIWKAFQAHVLEGKDAADVAASLGIRVGTVYAAKSRVLTRLRQQLQGLLD
jgi:RNA polymerase sigma-70 factor, ECF subfamily